MSERGGRCQEVTKLIIVDLEGVAELEAAADVVVGVELVAKTLEASSALATTNLATSGRTVLHQPLAEAMPEPGNATGATKQAIELLSALQHRQQLRMSDTRIREVQGGRSSADIATILGIQLTSVENEHLTWH